MPLIQSQISTVLQQGGTVVVPTRQRAVALRLAHTRARLAARSTAWPSPDICSWSDWLDCCAGQARRGALRGRRRLGRGEEWLLWREAAREACEGSGLLEPAGLADALCRAAHLQDAWDLRWSGAAYPEYEVLLRARAAFRRHCQALNACSAGDWRLVLEQIPAPRSPLLCAGFGLMGAALAARLRTLGVTFPAAGTGPGSSAAAPERCAAVDSADELRRAANWCRERLEQDSAARLLVVIPRLAELRAGTVQAFEHELHGGELLSGRGDALFALEGGQALSDYPLIGTALGLLALAGAPLGFAQLSALLCSPYLSCGSAAQRAVLELRLRERNVHAADFSLLLELARAGPPGQTAALGAALETSAPAMSIPRGTRAGAGGWARRYAAMLEAMGWPGTDSLGSDELQQRDRFRELLGELATLEAPDSMLRADEAHDLLRALADRTAFEAESGDVPITVTSSLDDPLVAYDGLWVAGLGADYWPAPARPDPFLPIAAQREAGIPEASPQGQLLAARRAMAAWSDCTGQLVYSWPRFDGEVPLQPSHLLGPVPLRPAAAPGVRAISVPDRLVQAIRASALRELRPAEPASAWPAGRRLPGGTRALQLQSICPFRAVAELRLGAAPMPEPAPGLHPRERGEILHRALELLWRKLRGSRGLRLAASTAPDLSALVRQAVMQALTAQLARRALPLASMLVENEQLRLETLIFALLDQELARAEVAGFEAVQLEAAQDAELGGLPIGVRMDRVDRLHDGRVIVIDYKSGLPEPFRPLDERPRQAQLLAYAALVGGPLAGIAAVHLGAGQVRWRGAAAEPGLLPALARGRGASQPWPALVAHWREVIHTLAGEFAKGVAAVQPLPGACERCHLPALCRIAAANQPPPEPDPDEVSGDDG